TDPPPTGQLAATPRVGCYRVTAISSDAEFPKALRIPLTVRLRADSAYTWAKRRWFVGEFVPADSTQPRVVWAPASSDSIDLQIETFPVALRARFKIAALESGGRMELWDDTGDIRTPSGRLTATTVACSSAAGV